MLRPLPQAPFHPGLAGAWERAVVFLEGAMVPLGPLVVPLGAFLLVCAITLLYCDEPGKRGCNTCAAITGLPTTVVTSSAAAIIIRYIMILMSFFEFVGE